MEKKITYTYDPESKQLNVYVDGKLRGGFIGDIATNRFIELLGSGKKIGLTNMNTEATRKLKVRQLRAIWIKLGLDEDRMDYLQEYGVDSTAKLTIEQLNELIARFNTNTGEDEIRSLRSSVLVVINKLGIYVTNNDWNAVNNFLMSNKIAGKLLFQMNIDELKQLRKKLNSILYKREVSKAEIERLTINN